MDKEQLLKNNKAFYSGYYHKTIDRQEKQNNFYETL